MRIDTCPRCGTRRPDELQWCRKCGLDFHKAERGELPSDMRAVAPAVAPPRIKTVQDYWRDNDMPPTPPVSAPARVRVEVDRRWLARLFGNSMDVGCLAWIGGTVGSGIGWVLGLAVGRLFWPATPNTWDFLFQPAGATVGGTIGLVVGARIALYLISHWPTG
jgi:hypothetical protein